MSYYGLSLNSGNMPGSIYVNLTLSAVAELIGYFLCFLCFLVGRKWPHVVSMCIGGLACLSSVLVYFYFNGNSRIGYTHGSTSYYMVLRSIVFNSFQLISFYFSLLRCILLHHTMLCCIVGRFAVCYNEVLYFMFHCHAVLFHSAELD